MSITWILLIRTVFGGLVLLPFVFRRKVQEVKVLLLAGVCMFLFLFSFMATIRLGSPAMAVSMQLTSFIYITVISFYQNKKIDVARLFSILLIGAGIMINIMLALTYASPMAIFTGLLSGFCFMLYAICVKRIQTGNSLGVVSCVNIIAAGCAILIMPFNHSPMPASFGDILTVVTAGVFISGVSYALYGFGLKRLNIDIALLITFCEPVLNPVWVFLARGEKPAATAVYALGIVICGAVVNVLYGYFKTKNFKRHNNNDFT